VESVDWEDFIFKVKQLSGALGIAINEQIVMTPTRYTYSGDIKNSAIYIYQFFEGLGYPAHFHNFTINGISAQNVYAIKRGAIYPDEIVVIGAHYDSISENPNTFAPGANDDGSGTAAVMHVARLFSGVNTDRTIFFVVFSGEEQGLFGSQIFVNLIKNNKWNVVNTICLDMISYSGSFFGVTVEGTSKYQSLIDVLEFNFLQYSTSDGNFQIRTATRSYGSDHVSFQNAGIPAVLLIELDDVDTPYYHNTKDTWQTLNKVQTVGIIKGLVGAICDLVACND